MRLRPLLPLLLTGGVLTVAAPRAATAKSEFVDVIAAHMGLRYQPPCRLCHIQGTTGPGTLQTAFALSMLAHGLNGAQATVTSALDALAADATDSDGDGASDFQELAGDRDPNTAVDAPLGPGGPNYGCAVAPDRPRGRELGAAALLGIVAATLLIRNRARHS